MTTMAGILLILLLIANGAPIITRWLMGSTLNWPIDGGHHLKDGQRLFGKSKTLRGLLISLITTTAATPLLGEVLNQPINWTIGLLVALIAMIGDLLSSFIKRRLHIKTSGFAPGLDQIPESLLPLLLIQPLLQLSWVSVLIIVTAFTLIDFIASQALYRLHIRNRPY